MFRGGSARISHDLAAQLSNDAELLGLDGRTEIVRAALELLRRRAADPKLYAEAAALLGAVCLDPSIVDLDDDEPPPFLERVHSETAGLPTSAAPAVPARLPRGVGG